MAGCFITFEGGEGAGKSTQIKCLANYFQQKGIDVVITREPGGTVGAEAIRHVVLSGAAEPFGKDFEALLFAAARIDHVDQLIAPALQAGKIVLCDRFIDSTRVYQASEIPDSQNFLNFLEKVAINNTINDIVPHLTFILDIDAKEGMQRANIRRNIDENIDRFEKDTLAIQQQRRQAFLNIAIKEKQRCHIIDASQNKDKIAKQIAAICDVYLERNPL